MSRIVQIYLKVEVQKYGFTGTLAYANKILQMWSIHELKYVSENAWQ